MYFTATFTRFHHPASWSTYVSLRLITLLSLCAYKNLSSDSPFSQSSITYLFYLYSSQPFAPISILTVSPASLRCTLIQTYLLLLHRWLAIISLYFSPSPYWFPWIVLSSLQPSHPLFSFLGVLVVDVLFGKFDHHPKRLSFLIISLFFQYMISNTFWCSNLHQFSCIHQSLCFPSVITDICLVALESHYFWWSLSSSLHLYLLLPYTKLLPLEFTTAQWSSLTPLPPHCHKPLHTLAFPHIHVLLMYCLSYLPLFWLRPRPSFLSTRPFTGHYVPRCSPFCLKAFPH